MRGDFSRLTFDPGRAFDAVLAQQGRVNIDADWNEQQLITLHRLDLQARDIIGQSGAPSTWPGFAVSHDEAELVIGAGRYYVEGIPVDNPFALPYVEQPYRYDQTGIREQLGRVDVLGVLLYLEVWRRHVTSIEEPSLIDAALGVRDTTTRLQAVWQVQALPLTRRSAEHADPQFLLREREFDERLARLEQLAGHDQLLRDAQARLEQFADTVSQGLEDVPSFQEAEFRSRLAELAERRGGAEELKSVLARVEQAGAAWLRGDVSHLTHHEPAFRERLDEYERAARELETRRRAHDDLRALFDERETQREDLRARLASSRDVLRTLERDSEYASLAHDLHEGFERYLLDRELHPKLDDIAVAETFREWEELRRVHRPLLAARLHGKSNEALLENQLYRVEIHDGGKAGIATFVWSRDNGAIGFVVREFDGARISLNDLIVDDRSGLVPGQWIELLDDRNELANRPGEIIRIADIDAARGVVVLASAPKEVLDLQARPRVRRWEASGVSPVPITVLNHVWLPLENGIEVKFSGRNYRTGDSWTIASRADGVGLEWPPGGRPEHGVALPPFDAPHRFAELALVVVKDGKIVVHDRRKQFRALTHGPPAEPNPKAPRRAAALRIVGTNWHNDRLFERLLEEGLRITFDRRPDPRCAVPRAVRVSVEPHASETDEFITSLVDSLERGAQSDTAQVSFVPRMLRGSVELAEQNVLWRPSPELPQLMMELRKRFGRTLLLRVLVRGADLWSQTEGGIVYCDGWAPQEPRREDGSIGLQFPTGRSEAVSDFESWCLL